GNIFFTNSDKFFQISNISTIGYTDLVLSFGQYKSTNQGNNELEVEVSADGSNFTALSYSRPTGSGTVNWRLIQPTGVIPSTTNLHIRFKQTSTSIQFRIDDIKLTGILSSTCSGTPIAGTSLATPSSITVGNSVSLSLSGATAASD